MISPEQLNGWSSLGAVIGILLVAIRNEWRAMSERRASLREHEATKQAIAIATTEVNEVKKLVNGPLGVALKAGADFAAHLAKVTDKEPDILAALSAQRLYEEHEVRSKAVSDFRSAEKGVKAES